MFPQTCRIQNPDIQRASRVMAHGGAAGRGRAEQFAQETSDPHNLQGIEDTSPERLHRSTNKRNRTGRIQNPNIPREGRYGAAHGGTKGPGGNGQHKTPTGQFAQEKQLLLLSRRWENDLLSVSLEAQTKETLCKPMEEQNPPLTRGRSAVDPQFIRGLSPGPRALFVSGC